MGRYRKLLNFQRYFERTRGMFVSVCSLNAQAVRFKITERTKMSKIMRSYGERRGVDSTTLQFVFKGGLVGDRQTAQQLQLHDGDSIDAIVCGTCWNCGLQAAALLRCAQCKLSKYCSRDCQRRCVYLSLQPNRASVDKSIDRVLLSLLQSASLCDTGTGNPINSAADHQRQALRIRCWAACCQISMLPYA